MGIFSGLDRHLIDVFMRACYYYTFYNVKNRVYGAFNIYKQQITNIAPIIDELNLSSIYYLALSHLNSDLSQILEFYRAQIRIANDRE